MPTTLLRRFLDHFRSDDTDTDTDGRFVPSRLDMSIRYAHGGGDTDADREIRDIQEQAEKRSRR